MAYGFDSLLHAALFIVGLFWCVFVFRRLPADLAELSRTLKNYRASRNPHVLGALKSSHGQRERFRRDAARAFWTTLALQVLFFWPITILGILAILSFAWHLYTRIAGGL